MRLHTVPLWTLFLATCTDNKDTTATDSSATTGVSTMDASTAGTVGESLDGGPTITHGGTYEPEEPNTDGGDPACTNPAPGGMTCDAIGINCEIDVGGCDEVNDEVALQCTLEALRDRIPGGLTWFDFTCCGLFGHKVDVNILEDGTALARREEYADLCYTTGPDTHNTLEEPAYFDGCLAIPLPLDRLDCLWGALADELSVCALEYEDCSGL